MVELQTLADAYRVNR